MCDVFHCCYVENNHRASERSNIRLHFYITLFLKIFRKKVFTNGITPYYRALKSFTTSYPEVLTRCSFPLLLKERGKTSLTCCVFTFPRPAYQDGLRTSQGGCGHWHSLAFRHRLPGIQHSRVAVSTRSFIHSLATLCIWGAGSHVSHEDLFMRQGKHSHEQDRWGPSLERSWHSHGDRPKTNKCKSKKQKSDGDACHLEN